MICNPFVQVLTSKPTLRDIMRDIMKDIMKDMSVIWGIMSINCLYLLHLRSYNPVTTCTATNKLKSLHNSDMAFNCLG